MKHRITIEEVREGESAFRPLFDEIYQQVLDDVDVRRVVALLNMKEWYFNSLDRTGDSQQGEDRPR